MKDDHENALKTEAKNEFFAPEAKNAFFALDAEKLAFSTVFFMGENRLFDRPTHKELLFHPLDSVVVFSPPKANRYHDCRE